MDYAREVYRFNLAHHTTGTWVRFNSYRGMQKAASLRASLTREEQVTSKDIREEVRAINNYETEKSAIDQVVNRFFSAFNNKNGRQADLDSLSDIFVADGLIVKTCGGSPSVCNLAEFIAPRRELLNGGDLKNFSEQEVWERTDIFGSVAQRLCVYEKSGVLSGQEFASKGMKSIQLIKTEAGWKISSVAWDDEREGFSVPATGEEIARTNTNGIAL